MMPSRLINTVRRVAANAFRRLGELLEASQSASTNGPPPQGPPAALIGECQPTDASLTPEETLLLMQLPLVAKVKRHVITPIAPSGEIPSLVEEIRMTSQGKAISRTDFIARDGNGSVGRADQVKGLCIGCQQFSFQGEPCHMCGQFICPKCAVAYEEHGTVLRLCSTCGKKANWSRQTW